MEVFEKGTIADTVDLRLVMAPTEEDNVWNHVMSYESRKYGNLAKEYQLVKPDTLPANVFLMDEQNGIYIEEVLLGNTFYSSFSVGNVQLFSSLRNKGDVIEWEVISIGTTSTLSSGTEPDQEGNSTLVESYAPITTQKAVLKRKKE